MTSEGLRVRVAGGEVEGEHCMPGDAGAPAVRVWRGVPYAAPPVGSRRWRPPAPPAPWDGVQPARRFGDDFPQAPNPLMRAPAQSEDCLYLNVWSPAGAEPGSLPVLVWVHGGGFVSGSGADARCDGARLAAAGAVVVTFNYRAGVFGYFAHPALARESAHGVSGNYGLLDQLQALRWVREHVAAFGGDPRRITAFGVSAGSASLSLMLVCPAARGLFDRAILHSPGAGRPLGTLEQAQQAGRALGDDLDALRALSATELFALTPKLVPKVRGLTTPRLLRPIRDGWLLPEDERPAMLAGRVPALPVLVGSNADEGSLLTAAWPVDTLAGYRALLEQNFGHQADAAAARYPAAADGDVRGRVGELFADTQFNYGTRLIARTMAIRGPRAWRYLFTRRRPGQADGPHHGEEVGHVFGNLGCAAGRFDAPFDDTDRAVSRALSAAWLAFARDGDPNVPGQVDWPACDAAGDPFLEFGDSLRVGHGWRAAQLDFLDEFYGPG